MSTRPKVPKSFLTTREASDILGVSLRTVQLWSESGVLSYWKTDGGHRRIPRDSVERLLDRRNSPERVFLPERIAADEWAGIDASEEPLRILVVEDEPTLLKLYRLKLASWAIRPEVSAARNGFEALLRLGKQRPDLLITDLYMPELDGFRMLRTLSTMPEMARMEIAIVTGLEPDDIAAQGGLPEGVHLFSKPIPFLDLENIAGRLAIKLGRRFASAIHSA